MRRAGAIIAGASDVTNDVTAVRLLRATLLLLAALGLASCDSGPRELPWQIRFADPALAPRARAFEATIYLGGCAAGTAIYSASFLADGTTSSPAPPDLAPGLVGFGAVARDVECTEFAAGCTDRMLPSSDAFAVELVEVAGGPACPARECTDGFCGVVAMDAGPPQDAGQPPDAGAFDAAGRDAGPIDAGMRADGGVRDGGATVPADAGPCPSGYADCDGMAINGCEVNILTSKPNCGRCGNHCTGGALASCCAGMCVAGRCP